MYLIRSEFTMKKNIFLFLITVTAVLIFIMASCSVPTIGDEPVAGLDNVEASEVAASLYYSSCKEGSDTMVITPNANQYYCTFEILMEGGAWKGISPESTVGSKYKFSISYLRSLKKYTPSHVAVIKIKYGGSSYAKGNDMNRLAICGAPTSTPKPTPKPTPYPSNFKYTYTKSGSYLYVYPSHMPCTFEYIGPQGKWTSLTDYSYNGVRYSFVINRLKMLNKPTGANTIILKAKYDSAAYTLRIVL